MKNLWLVIDNSKIEVKERMRAMKLIMRCYYMRSKLLSSEAFSRVFRLYKKSKKVMKRALRIIEEKISEREKALERTLKIILKMKT